MSTVEMFQIKSQFLVNKHSGRLYDRYGQLHASQPELDLLIREMDLPDGIVTRNIDKYPGRLWVGTQWTHYKVLYPVGESVRDYFSDDIAGAINIRIDKRAV